MGGQDSAGKRVDTRTPSQKASLLKLITQLTQLYRCRTVGHCDYDSGKVCPCFNAKEEYGNILRQVLKISPK